MSLLIMRILLLGVILAIDVLIVGDIVLFGIGIVMIVCICARAAARLVLRPENDREAADAWIAYRAGVAPGPTH